MQVLVSGAGIAGLASALELGRRGHAVTVVEYARQLRRTGTPIDIRGDAIAAVDGMGLLPRIRRHRVRMSELTQFVDSAGEPVARIPLAEVSDSDDDIELLRADLVRILAEALPDSTVVRFDDSIAALTADDTGVDVRFSSGRADRYDLAIGADGEHSTVRGLLFGPEERHARHLGVYFALAELPDAVVPDINSIYNVPGRMAGVFRFGGKTVANFQFRSAAIDYDHRNPDAQKRILVDAFAGYRSWRIPELLDAARADPDFYFTAARQIRLPSWHRGRVVLVGDAGYCPAYLSGRGTSLALTGARFLAEALERHGARAEAFTEYEARQRPYVTFAQGRAIGGLDRIVPTTWADIATRNAALRSPDTVR